jgi:hypothetical protein
MGLFDSVSQAMYTIFFGGISQFYFDAEDSVVYEDLNVPFTADISCIIRQPDGSATQELLPVRFDQLLGSNAVFIPSMDASMYENGVLRLHDIDGEIFAGYIYGGIDAEFMNFTPSTASNRIFKLYIQYEPEEPVNIQSAVSDIGVFPNPAGSQIMVSGVPPNSPYRILDAQGGAAQRGWMTQPTLSLTGLRNGIYIIEIYIDNTNIYRTTFVKMQE